MTEDLRDVMAALNDLELTGKVLGPLGKGEGVLLIQDGDTYTVEPLSRGQTG